MEHLPPQGRVDGSTCCSPSPHEGSSKKEDQSWHCQPEGNCIEARKIHVILAHHQRDQQVPQPPNQHRHHEEEDHHEGMSCEDHGRES